MPPLPPTFVERILAREQSNGASLLTSLDQERTFALRVNTLKITSTKLRHLLPFSLSPVPWCAEGFYYDGSERPGHHPLYWAGLYYIQEASAMYPVEALLVEPHHKVLDISAAPGGKATQILAKLNGKGLLIANETVAARAKVLSFNLESFGATNFVVTNSPPTKLAESFASFFDRILVDAPCSGEGLFRKEPASRLSWRSDHPESCALRQMAILSEAVRMLRPDGLLVYSTCTFAEEENEWLIEQFLADNPDMRLESAHRLLPNMVHGEGHFCCVLTKSGTPVPPVSGANFWRPVRPQAQFMRLLEDFAGERVDIPDTELHCQDQVLYAVPKSLPELKGLRIIKLGLRLGTAHATRFHPDYAWALSLNPPRLPKIDFARKDPELGAYLSGQVTSCTVEMHGWVLVCCEGFPIGFGKASQGQVKNHLPKGLRQF